MPRAVVVWLGCAVVTPPLVPDFGTVLGWLHAIEFPDAAEFETEGRPVVVAGAAELMRWVAAHSERSERPAPDTSIVRAKVEAVPGAARYCDETWVPSFRVYPCMYTEPEPELCDEWDEE